LLRLKSRRFEPLEIVEVAYRRLTIGRRVIWLRIGFWISMLGIEIRNSLNFLRVFFSTFRYYGYSRRYWLLPKFFDVSMGVVSSRIRSWICSWRNSMIVLR
jgi:hypothetical protein